MKVDTLILKQEEALPDDKEIQVEIIQDNGPPKEIIDKPRERCATFESSVEELFETIEKVLENENKPLPNAECIFTESNLEFSVPKEAR